MSLPDGHPPSFYVRQPDGALVSTEATRGPWNVDHQHGGPPTALLLGAVERFGEDAGEFTVARLTAELLQPIAIDERLRVDVQVTKLGGQAQRLRAELRGADGRVVAGATALRLRRVEVAVPSPPRHAPLPPLRPPAELATFVFPFFRTPIGYHSAVELRVARGEWGAGGCAAWLRPRVPLVAGEPTSPLECVAIAADALNGVAMVLPLSSHAFVNADLTIALARPFVGEWVGLDARATADRGGTGLNVGALFDAGGEAGLVLQSILVRAAGRTRAP